MASYTQFCRIKGCGGAGCPPRPIIVEKFKLPQQIIYHWKGSFIRESESFKIVVKCFDFAK